eukprot:751028-Hanusia_phi.AAC.1
MTLTSSLVRPPSTFRSSQHGRTIITLVMRARDKQTHRVRNSTSSAYRLMVLYSLSCENQHAANRTCRIQCSKIPSVFHHCTWARATPFLPDQTRCFSMSLSLRPLLATSSLPPSPPPLLYPLQPSTMPLFIGGPARPCTGEEGEGTG